MPTSVILFLRRLLHYAFHLFGGVVIVMSLVALVLKFWFMPDVDRFRPDLEMAATEAVGVPVRIGAMSADWQGIHPRLTLMDVRLEPFEGEALLFPKVEAIGSWFSLAVLEPRLRQLSLENARFPLRRAVDGVIYLADIPLNGPGAPSPFPDWLLRQGRLIIKNAQVSWQDEKLGAPVLTLSGVRLMLENRFGRHRFGGVALPSDAAGRVDVRGDLRGGSVHRPETWSGLFYAQVAQARFDSWGQWVPWAQQAVHSGRGDLRFWLTLDKGQARELTGDARLADVAVSIGKDLADLRFDRLAGRMGWGRNEAAHTLFVDKLRFQTPNGRLSEPARLRVTLTPDRQDGFKRIEAEAGNLRLEALTALTGALPLPRRGHDLITALAPRGLVESARGHWAGPGDYALHLRMRQAGMQTFATLPGLSGLDFNVEANQDKGRVELLGRDLKVDMPLVFRHQLVLDQLDGTADWQARKDGLEVNFNAKRLANADLDGEARGSILLPEQGAPVVDIDGHLSRGQANAVYRYLPLKVGDNAYEWIKRGLLGGHSDDVRLTLKGPLDRFPFTHGGGEFLVRIRMVDGSLDYAEGWPTIQGVHGMLAFQGQGMHLVADRGRILDALLGPVKVDIPDLHSTLDEMVLVDGYARGELGTFLDFIRQSPVNQHTERFTEPFTGKGQGVLALKLNLPVRRLEASTVGGAFTIHNGLLSPGADLPELSQINGAFTFTEKSLQGQNLQLRLMGMPAQLDLENQPGAGVVARMAGTASSEILQTHLPKAVGPLLKGSTQWQANVGLSGGGQASELTLTSNLAGLAVDLPAPLGKSVTQTVPLSVRYLPARAGKTDESLIQARYGAIARLTARMPPHGQARINVHLGTGEAPEPNEAGLWLTGNIKQADLDPWRRLDWPGSPDGQAQDPTGLVFRQAAMSFGEVCLFDRCLHETHLRLTPSGKGWSLQVAGKEANGEVVTVPEPKGHRVIAHFKRLDVPGPKAKANALPADQDAHAQRMTNLSLIIQSLAWKKMELGELRMRLSPIKTGFQVDTFQLTPPEGKLEGSGTVSDHPRRPSRLQIKLSSPNLGKLLDRIGHGDAIKGGEVAVSGDLGWTGGLEDFDIATLEGDLDITARKGQFLKMDPGAGRLLGVLSLQSLPRRITLDFRDVFSQGFAFDEIAGQVHIERGSAYAKDLRMSSPAAKVNMSGVVNLAQETQNLNIQVQPHLEEGVAVAGAILGGPVVGLGTLLAGKILKNPFGQALGFDYTVTGTWADPIVTKVPRKKTNSEEIGQNPGN